MSRSYTSSPPHVPPWRVAGQLYFTFTSIYIKRLGMFPFKVQLFQGCKSETEPINTQSVVQRYQVLLAAQSSAVSDVNCVYKEIYE
jgi:hypothetical protein